MKTRAGKRDTEVPREENKDTRGWNHEKQVTQIELLAQMGGHRRQSCSETRQEMSILQLNRKQNLRASLRSETGCGTGHFLIQKEAKTLKRQYEQVFRAKTCSSPKYSVFFLFFLYPHITSLWVRVVSQRKIEKFQVKKGEVATFLCFVETLLYF